MARCTISPLDFTMAMKVLIRASRWVVGGERLASGMLLPPIRAYIDDMTTMTTTVACTIRLLGKLTDNIEWARMQFKPSKSRSISIVKAKVVDTTFFINGEVIPTVSEKPVKSLGRWYDGLGVGLYSKGIFQLPVSALTKEFKCAKVRLELTLVESHNKCVREAASVLKTGRKWSAKKSVVETKAALQIVDIVGQVKHGRGGFWLSLAPPK